MKRLMFNIVISSICEQCQHGGWVNKAVVSPQEGPGLKSLADSGFLQSPSVSTVQKRAFLD